MRILGIDEAGRGPLAGPLVVCGFVYDTNALAIEGVRDSKKLPTRKRELIYTDLIKNEYTIVTFDQVEIDKLNILNATILGIKKILEKYYNIVDQVLIDGKFYNAEKSFGEKTSCIVDGDNIHYAISCASIIAKVVRDNYMVEVDKQYPQYGFAKNKGYGTKSHYAAIEMHGISKLHRKTYVEKLL